jgi:UDP-N-acetylmuramoylalanine--D-glutamate ligase
MTPVILDPRDPDRCELPPNPSARVAIVSPGFRPDDRWIQRLRTAGLRLLSELDLGAAAWAGPIIGITGTDGKSTVTAFLAHALQAAGRAAIPCGNFGKAFAGEAARTENPDTIALLEVSSFQAYWTQELTLGALVFTSLAEDHADWHGGPVAYAEAKARLFDRCAAEAPIFLGPGVADRYRVLGLAVPAQAVSVLPSEAAALGRSRFASPHQRANFALAAALWKELGLPLDSLIEAVRTFPGLPHRLERLATGTNRPVCWNDSKATTLHASAAALASLDGTIAWIVGGRCKGKLDTITFRELARRATSVITIGEIAEELTAALSSGPSAVHSAVSVEAAVESALSCDVDHILFSPGFASFDAFPSYAARGDAFRHAVLRQAHPFTQTHVHP